MALARFAWGIDIGNRALKAIKLVPDVNGYRIDDFDLIEHETVLSNAGDNRDQLIETAINTFVSRHNMKGGVASIGVSGQQSFARFIKLPPVEPKKIPEIVRFEAIQQIPFPLDDVEWSYQLFQDPASPDVEVGIFAMRKELINRHIQFFTDVDLNVQVVQMNPLAVYNAMQYDGRLADGTTMIVDLGAENTDLIIAEGENIWLRSIPIGGNNFTEALVKAFKVQFPKAEELKRNAATSKYQRQIFQAMRPVFSDLVGEIQRSIGFYASVHRESRIEKIIALGGTFRLPTLQKYLQQNLQVNVERIDSLGAGTPADTKLATLFNENILSTPTAYGLALQAMGEGKITSSLLPEAIRREKMWRDKTKWFAAAAALVIAGAGVAVGSTYIHRSAYDAAAEHRSHVDSVKSAADKNDAAWATIERAGSTQRQQIQNISTLTKYRDLWRDMLAGVHQAVVNTQPQPEIASGDVEQMKQIPRNERRQLFLQTLSSRYMSDVSTALAADSAKFQEMIDTGAVPTAGGAAGAPVNMAEIRRHILALQEARSRGGPMPTGPIGAPAPGSSGEAAKDTTRGYMFTLNCVTPHKQPVEFVTNTLIRSLLSLDEQTAAERGFYVAKAEIVSAAPIGSEGSRDTPRPARSAAGAGTGPQIPAIALEMMRMHQQGGAMTFDDSQPVPEEPVDPFLDRLTGETTRDDHRVTVGVLVVVEPPPGNKKSAAAQ